LPLLVSCTVCAALAIPETDVKLRVAGVSDTTGAGAGEPVPSRATVCGEPAALSATERLALNVATALGVKVTEIVQLEATASDPLHVLVSANVAAPVPFTVMLPITSAALPVLLS